MASQKALYGITTILVALLVISSSLAAYYFFQYNQEVTNSNKLTSELQVVTPKYDSLATRYDDLLSEYNGSVSSFVELTSIYNSTSSSFLTLSVAYNATFSLLVGAISELNTSEPAYLNASSMLTRLWTQYLGLVSNYKQISQSYENAVLDFDRSNNLTISEQARAVPVSILNADILIYFDNGTADWYNNTSIQPSWNFYDATLVVTGGNVVATWYPEYSSHYVTAIDGVSNDNAKNTYWFLWTYNATSSWQSAQVGPDELPMYNGSVYAWTYCGENSQYVPTCTPP
jgi:hypothetical protein